jgi:hypothetical protein
MKENVVLERNSKGINAQIVAAGAFTLLLCILITIFFTRVTGMDTRVEGWIVFLSWIILPLLWLVGSVAASKNLRQTQVVLGPDTLAVQKKSIFGTDTQLYRYDSILSVHVKSGYLGKKYGYGTIALEIPKLNKPVVLDYISTPELHATNIKKEISSKSSTQSLIN